MHWPGYTSNLGLDTPSRVRHQVANLCITVLITLMLFLLNAGSFNAVDLAELETASHFVKYAVASYAIIPVTENPEKK